MLKTLRKNRRTKIATTLQRAPIVTKAKSLILPSKRKKETRVTKTNRVKTLAKAPASKAVTVVIVTDVVTAKTLLKKSK